MAQIYPDFYTIQHLRQPATEGELILLDFLQKNLNMEFEIYYHPFINGDRPNIVILKKGCGAIIISVNDWDLTDYAINDDLDWWNNSTSTKVQSPFSPLNVLDRNGQQTDKKLQINDLWLFLLPESPASKTSKVR